MSAGLLPDPTAEGLAPEGLPILETPPLAPPRVNLLPPEIAAQRAVRKLAAALAGAVVLCAAAVGGGYAYAGAGEDAARADLATAQSVQAGLQRQQRALAPAQQTQTQIQAAQAALGAAMGNEVLWSRYLDQLRLSRPEGVRFATVNLTPSATTGATPSATTGGSGGAGTGAGAGAAVPGAIATITITGKARSQPDVAALLDVLAQIKGFTGVYLTSTDGDAATGVVSYTVTAAVTPEALSHRYTGGGS
jgi:Tfp pilus assembly protein PilN